MKAIVLAAGKGSRLHDQTITVPKPMLAVGGQPVLAHNIAWLRQHGITDLTLNLHHLPQVIRDYFGDGSAHGVRIAYSYEEHLLGTAGAVRRIVDDLWGGLAEPCLIVYGDNRMAFALPALLAAHAAHPDAAVTIAVYPKEDVSQSGIVLHDGDGRITRFIEKPPPLRLSNLVNAGLYVLSPAALPYLPPGRASDFGHDIFPAMLAAGAPLYACACPGTLIAIDTPELYRQATSS